MNASTLVLLCASSLFSMNALAQWQWLDAQGRKVFSDMPPPAQVSADRIIQRPGTAPATVRPAAPPAPQATAASGTAVAGVDKELQARKAVDEAEQAQRVQAQAQAQEKKQAQERGENCARAKGALATLADGALVGHTNAGGERAFMSETTRAAERQRAQAVIASDCGAKPRPVAPQ